MSSALRQRFLHVSCAHPRRRRYIRCGVCQELAKNLARELKELREEKGAKARHPHPRAAAAAASRAAAWLALTRAARAAAEGVRLA